MPDQRCPFPFAAPNPMEPPEEYAKLRDADPVAEITLPSGDPAWLITRYEDVQRVLSDQRFSREAITAPGAPRVLPIAAGSKSIFVMDPPEHSRLRRLISKAFSPRRIESLRPRIQEITDELLGSMEAAGPPADLIAGLARPLPIRVICELLGVPYEDVPRFRDWTDAMLSFGANSVEAVIQARDNINDYLTRLIGTKQQTPADDLLSSLVIARDQDDRLTEEELLAFGYTLLGAGYHATTAEITHGFLLLMRDPGLTDRLRRDPSLLPAAAEEVLRYSQAGGGLGALRIAVADVEVGGRLIRSGEAVLPMINSANRDESVFAEADRFDPGRSPNPHVAFGYGIHHCVGAQLGRTELEVALGSLLRRFDGLRLLKPEAELQWSKGVAFSTPHELRIDWK
jgi:cytochrome P450